MTKFIAVLSVLICITSQSACPQDLPPQEESSDAVSMFYSDLAPYGEWIELGPGFYGWHPSIMDATWRPYTIGHWVWSDYGWYWVSAEPFGWATYHYGRWYLDDNYGWLWIPDPVWGPAWVEWRNNEDYVGWAPLPPYARFHLTVGIRFTRRWVAPFSYWSFVTYDHFASGRPYHSYAPESYTRRLISTSRSVGRYQMDQNHIINEGVERSYIDRRTSNRVGTFEVTETNDRGAERLSTNGRTERIEVYRARPNVASDVPRRIVARRAETRPSLDLDRVEHYRGVPQRGARGSRIATQPFRVYENPDQSRQQQRPQFRGENQNRDRSAFPSPRLERTSPHRQHQQQKDDDRHRKRDRF